MNPNRERPRFVFTFVPLDPQLTIGGGGLGFWKALPQVFGTTRVQRCWKHKTANVLNYLPKALQAKAKAHLRSAR